MNWLERHAGDMNTLRKFIFGITGSYVLSNNFLNIVVLSDKDPKAAPTSHTCFFRFDIPMGYPDQAHFDEKMEWFLSAVKDFHFA